MLGKNTQKTCLEGTLNMIAFILLSKIFYTLNNLEVVGQAFQGRE